MNLGIFRWTWRFLFGQSQPASPLLQPQPKYYLFNETGNILICSSAEQTKGFENYVRDAFTDVSVFLAAMTKALATIQISDDKDNGGVARNASIYNYEAIKQVFANSGMFIQTNKEHGYLASNRVGEGLGKHFVQTVLGRSFNDKHLAFTRGMFAGMRSQEGHPASGQQLAKGGHVFFICEILNGLPMTSVVLVTIEPLSGSRGAGKEQHLFKRNEEEIDIHEFGMLEEKHYGKTSRQRTWRYRKRTYLFVPPSSIATAAHRFKNLQTADQDALVQKLKAIINDNNGVRFD